MIAEAISIAHPDRMADLLAAKLITVLQTSPKVHAAIEVTCVNKTVIFSGESNVEVNKTLLKKVVKEVFEDCGYERKSLFKDGKDYVSSKKVVIKNLINEQSKDIAVSTTDEAENSGWNDQGIFFASTKDTPTGQDFHKFLAQSFCDYLFEKAKDREYLGTDIKVLVSGFGNEIGSLTVAIPTTLGQLETKNYIYAFYLEWVKKLYEKYNVKVNINPSYFEVNTSGIYRKHGMIADTGLTGRKIAYNCLDVDYKNGGGSMIKPWHSADLLVPLFLRDMSKKLQNKPLMATTQIGKRFLNVYSSTTEDILDVKNVKPIDVANAYNLFDGKSYYKLVKRNFV